MSRKKLSRGRGRSFTRLLVERLEDRRMLASYALTDLGSLGGSGFTAQAYDINEAGQVVGYAVNSANQGHGFRWESGVMTDLGTLGGRASVANAINEAGQIAGGSTISNTGPSHAFVWEDGTFTDLAIGQANYANGISDAGHVVGTYDGGRGFLWEDGVFTDLGSLGTAFGGGAFPSDVNNARQVVGASTTDVVTQMGPMPHAFVWQNGVMTDLGVFPGDTESSANAINSFGHIVGYSGNMDPETYDMTSRSFLYNGTTKIDIGVPSFRSVATDINDFGHIVGTMRTGGGFSHDHAYIYENGVVKDLNSLIPAGSGLHLTFAYAINNGGQIVGAAVDSAWKTHAFLLTPIAPNTSVLNIGDASVTEGNSGTRLATFTITLSPSSSQPVTVDYVTTNGLATAGSDYQATSGTVTFAPGQTSKTVTVQVNGDQAGEPNETFQLNLTQATGAVIGDGQGVGTIIDDEPRLTINDVTKKEGHSGTTLFVFTVKLSAPTNVAVTVNYFTSDGMAKAGQDYDAKSGSITFAPGETTKTISIVVRGDRTIEGTEVFGVHLTNSLGAFILDGQGIGTIQEDDR